MQREKETAIRCLACKSPMGAAEVCLACGWTYLAGADEQMEPSTPSQPEESEIAPRSMPLPPPVLPRWVVWWEILVVLSIGILPYVLSAIASLVEPPPLGAYWLDSLLLAGGDACTILAVLYLMSRSGESWELFGLRRPDIWDFVLGMGLVIAADVLWKLITFLVIPARDGPYLFPLPRTPTDHVWMFVKYSISGVSEELVSRCYLIPRLRQQLRSPTAALVISAAAFASFHAYQGLAGIVNTFAFGLLFGAVYLLRPRIAPLAIGHALGNMCIELGV